MRAEAVILAGGGGRRVDGADKAEIEVAGKRLLEIVVDAVAHLGPPLVVGPRRPLESPARWVIEEPAGGGPVPALAAGLRMVRAPLVVVLAVDLPFITSDLVDRLVDAVRNGDGAIAQDSAGLDQPLVAAYRRESLQRAVDRYTGTRLSDLIATLTVTRIGDPRSEDCDTWDEIERAGGRLESKGEQHA